MKAVWEQILRPEVGLTPQIDMTTAFQIPEKTDAVNTSSGRC